MLHLKMFRTGRTVEMEISEKSIFSSPKRSLNRWESPAVRPVRSGVERKVHAPGLRSAEASAWTFLPSITRTSVRKNTVSSFPDRSLDEPSHEDVFQSKLSLQSGSPEAQRWACYVLYLRNWQYNRIGL